MSKRPFEPPLQNVPCKVVSVYDGDTFTIAFLRRELLTGEVVTCFRSCRLKGVDAPEIKSSDVKERLAASRIQEAVRDLICDRMWSANTYGIDKWGRLLIDLRPWSAISDSHPDWGQAVPRSMRGDLLSEYSYLSEWLLDTFAPQVVPYDGRGPRPPFASRR